MTSWQCIPVDRASDLFGQMEPALPGRPSVSSLFEELDEALGEPPTHNSHTTTVHIAKVTSHVMFPRLMMSVQNHPNYTTSTLPANTRSNAMQSNRHDAFDGKISKRSWKSDADIDLCAAKWCAYLLSGLLKWPHVIARTSYSILVTVFVLKWFLFILYMAMLDNNVQARW